MPDAKVVRIVRLTATVGGLCQVLPRAAVQRRGAVHDHGVLPARGGLHRALHTLIIGQQAQVSERPRDRAKFIRVAGACCRRLEGYGSRKRHQCSSLPILLHDLMCHGRRYAFHAATARDIRTVTASWAPSIVLQVRSTPGLAAGGAVHVRVLHGCLPVGVRLW